MRQCDYLYRPNDLQRTKWQLFDKIGSQKISVDDVQRMVQERIRSQELVQQTEQSLRDLQSKNRRLGTDLVEEVDQEHYTIDLHHASDLTYDAFSLSLKHK